MRRPVPYPTLIFCAVLLAAARSNAGDEVVRLDGKPELAFATAEGNEANRFIRQGSVAAHVQLRSGRAPRLLVAFPAGDSGVALWLRVVKSPVSWEISSPLQPITVRDAQGRPLRGVQVEITARASKLIVGRAVMGSIRTIRDLERTGDAPTGLLVPPQHSNNQLDWARDRIDGRSGYRLSLRVLGAGQLRGKEITAPDGRIRLLVFAVSGETPLTPLPASVSLTSAAGGTPLTRDVFAFLSYREKFLAGSWRFDTYFGRDTLITLALTRHVLTPEALADGFRSVLARTSAEGEVAHEEIIGEYAVLLDRPRYAIASAGPRYDYTMIDESFLLAPVIEPWLLSFSTDRQLPRRLLAETAAPGTRMGDRLVRNLLWVVRRTEAFAGHPVVSNMIGLKEGTTAGNWRDSADGLGGGKYPYDVNAVLAPAALRAVSALVASGLLDTYLSDADRKVLAQAPAQLEVWDLRAADAFTVFVPVRTARGDVLNYSKTLGIDPRPALRALLRPISYSAIALRQDGQPVPVMHSDGGFAFLFGDPDPQRLVQLIGTVMRPFPAGLSTPVGMLVANPVFADSRMQPKFGRTAYHGTVVWSWQQALLAAGLERQLTRADLPASIHARLKSLRTLLWSLIRSTKSLQNSELWSWSYKGGYQAKPYVQLADESNAAQLWSTTFLAWTERGGREAATQQTESEPAAHCDLIDTRGLHSSGNTTCPERGAMKQGGDLFRSP